jgi:hypothetical protein
MLIQLHAVIACLSKFHAHVGALELLENGAPSLYTQIGTGHTTYYPICISHDRALEHLQGVPQTAIVLQALRCL